MFKSSCRGQFTADDFQFVVDTLGKSPADAVNLVDLLTDEETRDLVLDHELIYEGLVDHHGCLKVSPAFYFYVVTRRVLRQAGMKEVDLADYIASLLTCFTDKRKIQTPTSNNKQEDPEKSRLYISDLLETLSEAGSDECFAIRSHIADYSLFLSGMFIDRIRAYEERRGGPNLDFYEGMGKSNYRYASRHRLAKESALEITLNQLSNRFREVRRALNDLSSNVFHFHPQENLLIISPDD